MRVIQSVFIVSFLSLFVCYLCSFETDLINLFKQSEFVSPTDEQLQNFLTQVSEAALSHDLAQLSDPSVRSAFTEEIKQIFLETAGQISLQVPNAKFFPILQREIEPMIAEEVKKQGKRTEVTSSKARVSVPSSGVCANTYRIDMDVDTKTKVCNGFFDFLCGSNTARGKIDAHGCYRFEVTNWSIDTKTVNSDADYDGSGFWGNIAQWLFGDEINNKIRNAIDNGLQNIDLGEDVDEQIEKAITSAIDEFTPELSSLVENLNLDFDQQELDSLLLQIKSFVLDILSTDFLSDVDMEIQPGYLIISVGF